MRPPEPLSRHSAPATEAASTTLSGRRLGVTCRALYCLDVARGIDLQRAQASLTTARRTTFQHKSRIPEGAGISPPLRMSWSAQAVELGGHSTDDEVEIALFDFGALCITWSLSLEACLEELVQISSLLYDHAGLIARSRELAAELMSTLGSALDRPQLSEAIEDYVVFQTEPHEEGPEALLSSAAGSLARILRAERSELSPQEVADALGHPVSYGLNDLCLVDWLAAFLMGGDTDDERLVLELATVELLELRKLDLHLERQIEEAYELLTSPRSRWAALTVQRRELEHVARIQADDSMLREGIDNALKLFGDDYLARLHRTAARRFHFEAWGHSIQRKLEVLRSVYQSLADQASHRRSELLEWIIIVLIAVDIVLYFTPLR